MEMLAPGDPDVKIKALDGRSDPIRKDLEKKVKGHKSKWALPEVGCPILRDNIQCQEPNVQLSSHISDLRGKGPSKWIRDREVSPGTNLHGIRASNRVEQEMAHLQFLGTRKKKRSARGIHARQLY